jgi:exosortase/archaeosortase family protein
MTTRQRTVLLAAHLLALWPSLHWWARRLASEPDECWGALAWPLAFVLVAQAPRVAACSLRLPATALGAYALSYGLLPPLLSAGLGVLGLAGSVSALCLGRRLSLPLAAVLLLGLPVEASLQFYLGYPLRFVVASVAAPMLSTLGLDVVALGTQLSWHTLEVAVDGPCSGVRMLRTALLFSAVLSMPGTQRVASFALHLGFSLVALVLANAVRASSLFLIELSAAPFAWLHAGVGVCAFALLLWAQYAARVVIERPALAEGVPA